MTQLAPLARQILADWFGDDDDRIAECAPKWFQRDDAWDAHLVLNYAQHSERAAAGGFSDWEETALGSVALIVLLDQFSRNMYRGSYRSFAYDSASREICKRAIAKGFDQELICAKRSFVYMPLMHSEQPDDHVLADRLFAALVSDDGPSSEVVSTTHKYELMHKRIIDRFGRYPHRNEVLGRQSTAEEVAFLEQPNSSF